MTRANLINSLTRHEKIKLVILTSSLDMRPGLVKCFELLESDNIVDRGRCYLPYEHWNGETQRSGSEMCHFWVEILIKG